MEKGLFQNIQQTLGIGRREEWTETHRLPVETLNKVTVDVGAIDVFIATHNENWIDLEFTTFEEGPEMTVTDDDNELKIFIHQVKQQRWINLGMQTASLFMTVPASVAKEWNIKASSKKLTVHNIQASDLTIRLSSGKLMCKTIQTENLLAEATSGDIDMEQVVAEDTHVSITSGSMLLKHIHCNQLSTSTSSGSIHVSHGVSKKYKSKCTSGKIVHEHVQFEHATMNGTSGTINVQNMSTDYIKASVTSGDFSAMNLNTPFAQIEATSGDLFISLDASMTDFSIEGVASSGDVRVDIPLTFDLQKENHVKGFSGTGEKRLLFRATSGDVTVRS